MDIVPPGGIAKGGRNFSGQPVTHIQMTVRRRRGAKFVNILAVVKVPRV